MDPSLQDNVLIPDKFFEFISHVGCSFNMHSVIASRLVAGGKNSGRDRQTVFFTAVDRMNTHCIEQKEFDLTKTTTCCLQASVEGTSRCSILAIYWAYSMNELEVLPNKVKRDQSLRHSSANLH